MKKETIIERLSEKNLILVEHQLLIDTVKKRFTVKEKKEIKGGLYPGQVETKIIARRLSLEEIVKKFDLKKLDKLPDEPPKDTEPEDPEKKFKKEEQPIEEKGEKNLKEAHFPGFRAEKISKEEEKPDIDEAKRGEEKSAKQPKD